MHQKLKSMCKIVLLVSIIIFSELQVQTPPAKFSLHAHAILLFLFRFPTDPIIKKQWVLACKRLKLGTKNQIWKPCATDVICSDHFKAEDYSTTGRRKRLLATAVPSVFTFRNETSALSTRHIRYSARINQASVQSTSVPSVSSADDALIERLREVQRDLKNSKRREKRLKETVITLKSLLVEALAVKESLLAKLEIYKGTC